MKGLLQSKRFKKLLRKWLLMYVGVMLLFTTVVTYSKYITSQSTSDEAKITKFNVKINYSDEFGNSCSNDNPCNTGVYRPTSEIVYYFTVDANEVEVNSKLYITIRSLNSDYTVSVRDNGDAVTNNTIKYIVPSNNNVIVYKVVLKYNGTINKEDKFTGIAVNNILQIGFTAEQDIIGRG